MKPLQPMLRFRWVWIVELLRKERYPNFLRIGRFASRARVTMDD